MKVVFILPPEVNLLDVAGPAHIFYEAASLGATVQLIFTAILPKITDVKSNCALSVNRLISFDGLELNEGDIIFVPGLKDSLLLDNSIMKNSRDFQKWLFCRRKNGVTVCSVCTGAFLIAEAGLLDGKACTTHWKYAHLLKSRYPKVRLVSNRIIVKDGNIYTSAGVASSIDLALHLVENFLGSVLAAKIAKESLICFRRPFNDPQLNVFTQYRDHLDERIHNIQSMLSGSIDKKYNINNLSDEVNMSPRNLTRLFKKNNWDNNRRLPV